MYLSIKVGICFQTQVLVFPFHILGILHFMSDSHEASYSVHLGLTGSVFSCLWEGFPPPHLHGQHWCLAKHKLASWELEERECGCSDPVGKGRHAGSDWEMEYTLHHGKGCWGSICSPFSFLFGYACGTENANFSQLKANKKALCHLKKQSLLARCPNPWEPSQLQRPGPEYVLQTLDGKLQTAGYWHDLFSNSLRRYLNNWRSWWFLCSQWDHEVQFSQWLITMNCLGLECGHFAQCFTAGRS